MPDLLERLVLQDALKSWGALNEALRMCDEQGALKLFKAEKKGDARPSFLLRIQGRYHELFRQRERAELFEFLASRRKK